MITEHERLVFRLTALEHRIHKVEDNIKASTLTLPLAQDALIDGKECHDSRNGKQIAPGRIADAVKLHSTGWSFSRIARIVGVCEKTVQRWCEKGGK